MERKEIMSKSNKNDGNEKKVGFFTLILACLPIVSSLIMWFLSRDSYLTFCTYIGTFALIIIVAMFANMKDETNDDDPYEDMLL